MDNQLTRRNFLQTSGALIAAASTVPALSDDRVIGANDQVRLGLIGCGGRGQDLMRSFSNIPNVKFVAIADADTAQMERAAKDREGLRQFQDYRQLLDQRDIDAVVIASTNHWHALHTIHACQAGKDVYVEKPATFSVDQGPVMLAAANKHGRIVQAGTQNRSDTALIPAFEMIRNGDLGPIKSIRGLCYRNRNTIGKRDTPLQPPPSVNYDLWLGGSQELPIMRPKLHYDWHWDFNTGNGDVGNQAPHEFDLIAWVLGDAKFEGTIRSYGNRFGWNDAGNTPNMQTVWYELAGVPVIFEVNNLWTSPDKNEAVSYRGAGVGVIVTCEQGEFIGGRGGGYITLDGKTKLQEFKGDSGNRHYANFIDALRSRNPAMLRAPLENSIQSAAIPHYANMSYRTGTPVSKRALLDTVPATVAEVIERQEQQLKNWSIDLDESPMRLGSEITVSNSGEISGSDAVRQLAQPTYRGQYGMPNI